MTARVIERLRGFTLVELLVVIAIIGALSSIAIPMIGNARRRAAANSTQSLIQQMTVGIDAYEGVFGDYPPSSIEDWYDVRGNGLDTGIESVLLHLSSQKRGGPFFEPKEESIENLDGDSVDSAELREEIDWIFGDDQLREIVDAFGNPLIYIHNRDYQESFAITHEGGQGRGTATAGRSEKTATYFSPTSYQLWSSGKNLENENGAGDDIVAW